MRNGSIGKHWVVSYKYTLEDQAAWRDYITVFHRDRTDQRRRWALVLALQTATVGICWFFLAWLFDAVVAIVMVGPVVAAGLWAIWSYQRHRRPAVVMARTTPTEAAMSWARKCKESWQRAGFNLGRTAEEVELRVSEDQVIVVTPSKTTLLATERFVRCVEMAGRFILEYQRPAESLVIPSSAIERASPDGGLARFLRSLGQSE